MTMPKFLLGAAVLFWGWQTGLGWLALPLAIALEAHWFLDWQWALGEVEFRRIFNLCVGLLLVCLVYAFLSTDRSPYFIYAFMAWLPVVFAPLALAQVYAVSDRVNLRALFVGKMPTSSIPVDPLPLNLSYPYFALCVLAASVAYGSSSFYGGMVGLFAMALWFIRPRRSSRWVWVLAMGLAIAIGFVGQAGLRELHLLAEQQMVDWLSHSSSQRIDPTRKTTDVGSIKGLKRSSKIVLRVASEQREHFPLLLREASYNKYQQGIWLAIATQFQPLTPHQDRITWLLGSPPTRQPAAIAVTGTLEGGKGFLRLPDGAFQLNQLAANQVERNQYGTVQVNADRSDIQYDVQFTPGRSFDSAPTADDLAIPATDRPVLNAIVKQLDLAGRSPQEILKRVDLFFQTHFTYSLELNRQENPGSYLSTFLLRERSGHCEYFATATTLLLRAAGIPARYAIGYAVHEFSALENQYIVRSRNAHAWSLAYVEGHWQSFDTTPASWITTEDGNASATQWFSDLTAFLGRKWGQAIAVVETLISGGQWRQWWWLSVPLLVLLVRQMKPTKRVRRLRKVPAAKSAIAPALSTSTDSPFYAIEQTLTQLGWGRDRHESLKTWLQRLRHHFPADQIDALQTIIELHYRYRFDPQVTDPAIKTQLTDLSQSWLAQVQALPPDSANSPPSQR